MKLLGTHNTLRINATNTSLSGHFSGANRAQLTKLFGEPMLECGEKVSTLWYIKVEDNSGGVNVITIYDWHSGYAGYDEDEDCMGVPASYNEWNVGARYKGADALLYELIEELNAYKPVSNKAKFVREVNVTDPDTGGEVPVAIYKDINSGGMFGVDASYIQQEEPSHVPSPFNDSLLELVGD